MIHRLHETDAYAMLARGIPRNKGIIALDVGAHTGSATARIRSVFPESRVFAFEPAPEPADGLARLASGDPRIMVVRAAAGERDGRTLLRETRNPLLSSVLKPTGRTVRETFGAGEVLREIEVPMLRLETWARGAGVEAVDLLKIDVQGTELGVLRGAGGLLDRTASVYAEAHLEPAYEGAATFSEIDLFLRDRGLVLHQVHELTTRGEDLQTVQLDALWLRRDLLEAIRSAPLERATPPRAGAFLGALERCARLGIDRVALYGAGTHTRSIAPWFGARPGVRVVAVLDDDPARQGEMIAGLPVIAPGTPGAPAPLEAHQIRGVILSSDSFEDELWRRSRAMRHAGIPVFRLYGRELDGAC
jgi:FkbM family methyltransferase